MQLYLFSVIEKQKLSHGICAICSEPFPLKQCERIVPDMDAPFIPSYLPVFSDGTAVFVALPPHLKSALPEAFSHSFSLFLELNSR